MTFREIEAKYNLPALRTKVLQAAGRWHNAKTKNENVEKAERDLMFATTRLSQFARAAAQEASGNSNGGICDHCCGHGE